MGHWTISNNFLIFDELELILGNFLTGFGFVSFESEEVAKRICGEGFHKIKSKSVSVFKFFNETLVGKIPGFLLF